MTAEKHMTILEHLEELRRRIIVSAVAIVVGCVAAFVEKKWVFIFLKRPLTHMRGVHADLITLSPAEPFMTVLKVSIYAGTLLATPVILWQVWAFILPALYEREKKAVIPYVACTSGLFLGGVAFGYFIILPVGLRFLVGYGGDIFVQQLRASEYISFVILFMLASGLVFELPVVILLLASLDIVNYRMLRKWRPYAILVNAVIAAVVTPSQDPVSMLLMMAPLVILYEVGILLARVTARRHARREVALE